jgi:DNA polymerase III epsilon subunit-like protein
MNDVTNNSESVNECFISVDVETSGPIPGEFSLLSIGACVVLDDEHGVSNSISAEFYCTLKPLLGASSDPAALAVTGFSLDELHERGSSPEDAMLRFEKWLLTVAGNAKPIFVGLNAPFDWSFINYYFHRFIGRNPFGFTALDIKALFMGSMGSTWEDTRSSRMLTKLGLTQKEMSHHALDDARAQAEIFLAIRHRNVLHQA